MSIQILVELECFRSSFIFISDDKFLYYLMLFGAGLHDINAIQNTIVPAMLITN